MTQSEINPHAKERFQQSQANIDAHHDLIGSAAYQRAEDMAWHYYNRVLASNLAKASDPAAAPNNVQQLAMINGFKLLGVQEFLAEFRHLAEKPVVAQSPGLARTLNHKAN